MRYISEETKQFGKLITPVLKKMPEKRKEYLSEKLSKLSDGLNRSEERIDEINKIELLLNDLMCELMDCDIEIKMNIPKLDDLFVGTNIYINDGINTDIEAKGQGMQRAMIFTILRAYAKLETTILSGSGDKGRNIIFGIEEPELYLHPQSQRTLMSVFRDIANKGDQVICSTQSSLFVDINYFDQICIMRRERKDSNWESYSTQLQMSAFIDDLKARKDIQASEKGIREQYFNAFNPMVNEGFFADKVVIVEGPSEQYALPIYADILRYNLDRNNISVVHSDGKGQMDRLFRVFNEFRIPTYLWFDGDKLTKDSENRKKTLELLELVKDPVADIQEIQPK